ncbi:MAG: choice-of-anchor Q domain-containing protein [Myxococcota bacterium]
MRTTRPVSVSILLPVLASFATLASVSASAIAVDTTADLTTADCGVAGQCTLRQAILMANAAGGGTVELVAGSTYQLTQGGLTIDPGPGNDVTISVTGGPSPFDTAIDADADGRPLLVLTGRLDLSGVTVRNGDAGTADGGGILVAADAALDLTDVVVTGNVADDGGGLAIRAGAGASLLRVLVTGNRTTRTPASDGGGILNEGELVLRSTTVAGNHGTAEQGGGIFNAGSGTIAAEGSAILGHAASVQGGGLWSNSAASVTTALVPECDGTTAAVCLVDTAIESNRAQDGAGYFQAAGRLEMTGGRIATNAVIQVQGTNEEGGGLLATGGSADLLQVEVSDNDADLGGGILWSSGETLDVTEVRIADNRAGHGGGLYLATGTLHANGIDVLANRANVSGGGLFLGAATTSEILDTTIRDNVASANADNGDGAGLWSAGHTTVERSTISGNTITGVGAQNGRYGGGVFAFGDTLSIFDSTISGNSASLGGGIGSNSTGALHLVNVTLVFNTSTVASAGENLHHATASYTTTIRNSIVARAPGADAGSCNGLALTAASGSSFNLREDLDSSCGFNSTADRTFDGADLGALQDNGGLYGVETHALLGGDGIDAANDAICSTQDNRGFLRSLLFGVPVDCDMGAYEVEAVPEAGAPLGLLAGAGLFAVGLHRRRRATAFTEVERGGLDG